METQRCFLMLNIVQESACVCVCMIEHHSREEKLKTKLRIFHNWSNLIHCNWLKLRNFINTQCNTVYDIETSEPQRDTAWLHIYSTPDAWKCHNCVEQQQTQYEADRKKNCSLFDKLDLLSIVICNWICFLLCNEMRNADYNPLNVLGFIWYRRHCISFDFKAGKSFDST